MNEDRLSSHVAEYRERIAVLETQMAAMICQQAKQHKEISDDLRMILNTLAEARGGWRLMMLVGGAGGMIGAFVGKWASALAMVFPK